MVTQVPCSIAMGHGRRHAQIWKSERRAPCCAELLLCSGPHTKRHFVAMPCLPLVIFCCPCIRGDRLPVCDGDGGVDARHDSLDGNTCWDECPQVSTGMCGAQPVWNWEPLQRCIGGDLSNHKAGTKRITCGRGGGEVTRCCSGGCRRWERCCTSF